MTNLLSFKVDIFLLLWTLKSAKLLKDAYMVYDRAKTKE